MIKVRHFTGAQDYTTIWQRMRELTAQRNDKTEDEIWLLQHTPVFTLGQAGKSEHLLDSTAISHANIAVVKSDRGGQVTYHAPGQLIAYLLIDLKRRQLGVRELVTLMEQAIIATLAEFTIAAYAKRNAPGVYVNVKGREHKIASLGLRVRKGCCYHGLAFNVDMDLAPFALINPCGYAGLAVTQLVDLVLRKPDWQNVEDTLLHHLQQQLEQKPL